MRFFIVFSSASHISRTEWEPSSEDLINLSLPFQFSTLAWQISTLTHRTVELRKKFHLNENEHESVRDVSVESRASWSCMFSKSRSLQRIESVVWQVFLPVRLLLVLCPNSLTERQTTHNTHSCCGCHQRRLLIYIRLHFILTNDPQNLYAIVNHRHRQRYIAEYICICSSSMSSMKESLFGAQPNFQLQLSHINRCI